LLSEQLAHQTQRRPAIAAALDQHIKDFAFAIDGTPEVHPLAGNPDHHFIQVPSIARAGTALPQPPRDYRSELQHPPANGFVGNVEPAPGKEILDVSVAEREAQVDPDCMLDDNRAETGDGGRRWLSSGQPTRGLVPPHSIILTKPFDRRDGPERR